MAELAAKIKARTTERDALNRRLAAMDEPPDRAALQAALEQRVADWLQRLRSDHPDETLSVVPQLIGPLTLWAGNGTDDPPVVRAR